jgi:hypothetical protein
MGVHDTFRASGRSRGVVDRDHLLLVGHWHLAGFGEAADEELFVRVARRAGVINADGRQAAALDQVE